MEYRGERSERSHIPCPAHWSDENIFFDNLDDAVFVGDAQPPQLNVLRFLGSWSTNASVLLSRNNNRGNVYHCLLGWKYCKLVSLSVNRQIFRAKFPNNS